MENRRLLWLLLTVVLGCSGETAAPSTTADSTTTAAPSRTTVADAGRTSSTLSETTTTTVGSVEVCLEADVSSDPLAEPAFEGAELWDFYPEVDQHRVSPITSATVADGVVFVGASDVAGGDQGSLHALLPDGTVRWSYRHGGHTPSTPLVRGGVVFIGSEDHNLYAIDAETGEEIWHFATDGHIRTRPAVARDTVVVTSQDGYLYALDSDDGELSWSQRVAPPVSDSDSLGSSPPSPAIDEDAAYVAARAEVGLDWSLSAYDLSDGGLRWRNEVEHQVFRSPVAGNGMVFLSAEDLYGIDAHSGDTVWTCTAEGSFLSEPFPTSTAVYAASSDGSVYALDPVTGTPLWRTQTEVASLASPTVAEGVIYVPSTQGRLLALSSEGVLLSIYDLGLDVGGKPHAVADGVVYVVTRSRHFYAIDMFP